jgi:hypothetical protein
MAFNYNINVTGDCNNTSAGIINLIISGGSDPYTVQWITPELSTDYNISSVTKTNLVSGTYSIRVNDSTLPTNQVEFINIPVSSGVCCSILNVDNTTCSLNNGSVTGTSTTQYSSTNYHHNESSFISIIPQQQQKQQFTTTNNDNNSFRLLLA